MKGSIVIFADGSVGVETLRWLIAEHPNDIVSIVVNGGKSLVLEFLIHEGWQGPWFIFNKGQEKELENFLSSRTKPQFIILAWWPFIVKSSLLSIPTHGVVNFHPSLLPYNRGKHYNFWTIVEETPFGVSLHFVNESVDAGDVLFQKPISKSWLDTGESLYKRAQQAMVELFVENYRRLIDGNYRPQKQNLEKGSFHLAKEIEPASEILLDKKYTARELLNLLRARTFPPHPGCRFTDESGTYQVRIFIEKIS
jgi:methionyl-tRNA formyltransferase